MDIKNLAFRLMGEQYTRMAIKRRDMLTWLYSVRHPYHYDASRYAGTFLTRKADYPYNKQVQAPVDRVIYVFWTGDNEITPNRMAGIRSLEKISGVPVKLITPENLQSYIVDGDPLPEAYQYLSLVHRSDFLRGYFMYHHGGGYADIKTFRRSWVRAFDSLDASDDAFVIGYPEVGFLGAANQDMSTGNVKTDLHFHWRYLIGNGAFICRPHTQFTAEWYSESRRRLEDNTAKLKAHPAKDFFGTNADYPLSWSCIQGGIFHPLCLKFKDRLLKNKALKPSFKNYR